MSGDSKKYGVTGIASDVELGKGGPRLVVNGTVVENKDSAGTGFVVVRGAHPVDENDFVTKKFMETRANIIIVGQIDGGSPPAPAAVGRVFIVTTTGGTYTEGELYYDTGVAWELIPIADGTSVKIADALIGGILTFLGNHIYIYDADTTTWLDAGPAPGETSTVKGVWITVGYADVGANLIKTVPAGCQITKAKVRVTQIFNGTTPTMIIGDTGDTDRHMEIKHIDLTKVGLYEVDLLYLYGSSTAVNATLAFGGGTPSTGVATVFLEYAISA